MDPQVLHSMDPEKFLAINKILAVSIHESKGVRCCTQLLIQTLVYGRSLQRATKYATVGLPVLTK